MDADFDDFFSEARLNTYFARLLDRKWDVIGNRHRILPGADDISLKLFQRDLALHIATLNKKALEERYTFSPFLEREIPKPGSKKNRTISLATIRDNLFQNALYEYLYPFVEERLTDAVFGYRKGKSAHAAIGRIRRLIDQGYLCIFDADFSGFFDSVNHDLLLEKVRSLNLDSRAETFVRRFMKAGRITPTAMIARQESAGRQSKYAVTARMEGVPQGGILSGLLTNLFLADFDQAILRQAPGYIRYADDFLVLCKTPDECQSIRDLVELKATSLRLELHPVKTHTCTTAAEGVDFLGFRVGTKGVRISGSNKAKFKQRILRILENQKPRKVPDASLRRLIYRINFKIRGPNKEHMDLLIAQGKVTHRFRRSWIAFFRIVDDEAQIRSLDRWIRKQVSQYLWKNHRKRVRYSQMKQVGLLSLVNIMHRARAKSRNRIG
ncbi:MAG TPA: reverse transcriptase domain-containing protein [Gemmataceae bacterium]|nr:reverse transcriptase domain-containing protein [Gemmataceae bacterium]